MSKVGISAVNMKAGYYATNGYWNGNVWFSHQWFVWKTMLDLGESDFAYKIAKTALDAWKKEVEYSYYTFEMMSITTGRGGWFHNFGGLSAPVNIWQMPIIIRVHSASALMFSVRTAIFPRTLQALTQPSATTTLKGQR